MDCNLKIMTNTRNHVSELENFSFKMANKKNSLILSILKHFSVLVHMIYQESIFENPQFSFSLATYVPMHWMRHPLEI